MTTSRGAITHEGERYPAPRAGLDYLPVEPPAPGRAIEIAPGLLWARIPLPIELNHINVWLLEDGDGWTLVDTGMATDVCREAWETLEREHLGGRALRRIFVTHDHPDHMGLSRWLAERHGGAEVWMSAVAHASASDYVGATTETVRERLRRFMRRHGMELAPGATRERHDLWFDGVPRLSHAPRDGDGLAVTGRTWRLIETSGHCRGHLCLHDPAAEILVSGDQVLPTISPNVSVLASRPEADPLRDFLDSLARIEERCSRSTLVLPSHGRPFRGLHARIAAVRDHHLQQLAMLRDACREEPRSAHDLLPVMFGRTLRGFHRVLAMGEAIAHLHYLCAAGDLRRYEGEDGTLRFRTA